MFSQPAIDIQEAAWLELSWVLENCRVMQYGANQRKDLSSLGQSVSLEASGPRDGVRDSHGYQCQEPLCLM